MIMIIEYRHKKMCINIHFHLSDLCVSTDEEEKKERMQKVHEKRSMKESRKLSGESDKNNSNMIHSPNCAVTTTAREVASSPEQTASIVDQAWHTASEVNAADLAVLNSSASFLQEGRFSQEGLPIHAGQNLGMVLSSAETLSMLGQDSKTAVFSGSENPVPPPVLPFSDPPASNSSDPYPSEMWQTTPSPSTPATSQPQAYGTTSQSQDCEHDLNSIPSASLVAQSQVISTFQHVPRDELPSDPYMYWRLSEEERCLLTQLSAAYQDTILSVLKGSPPREVINSQLITREMYLQECELEARNVISFSKRMEDFRQLRQDEQIALLKASTCQVMLWAMMAGLLACMKKRFGLKKMIWAMMTGLPARKNYLGNGGWLLACVKKLSGLCFVGF